MISAAFCKLRLHDLCAYYSVTRSFAEDATEFRQLAKISSEISNFCDTSKVTRLAWNDRVQDFPDSFDQYRSTNTRACGGLFVKMRVKLMLLCVARIYCSINGIRRNSKNVLALLEVIINVDYFRPRAMRSNLASLVKCKFRARLIPKDAKIFTNF